MKSLFTVLAVTLGFTAFAQNFFTKSAAIRFFSSTPIEDIEAKSNQATSIISAETGEIVFKVLMTSFQFEKALMQEHFNEKYVESDKYPNAVFKGSIDEATPVDFNKKGDYKVKVSGDLTLHGVTKPVNAEGAITVTESGLLANSVFTVKVADFDIKVPGAVKDNIAETIEITVNGTYEPLKK